MTAAVEFDGVDVVFGREREAALRLLDEGADKDAVFERTGSIVGVQGATFAVERGEIFVLMGLSGSGKSSLLRCVNGLNRASRGRILVEDGDARVDITSCAPPVLRQLRMQRVSMVFQQFALMPWRRIADNVAFGLEIRGVARAERERRVHEVLELVHLAQWADTLPHELSGGMQQRVGLARAFATDAEILLMDEPFSALDPLIREHLQDELLELQKTLRRTILFVSHDLDEALKIGSHVAIMEGGRIVQIGAPEEIITRPRSDYVRRFVANVNPLNVLRGVSLMRAADALSRDGDRVILDAGTGVTCGLDAEGRPIGIAAHDRPLRLVAPGGREPGALAPDEILAGDEATTMRAVIEARHATGRPMPLLDGGGRLIGAIGEAELLAGMLRRPRTADADA